MQQAAGSSGGGGGGVRTRSAALSASAPLHALDCEPPPLDACIGGSGGREGVAAGQGARADM